MKYGIIPLFILIPSTVTLGLAIDSQAISTNDRFANDAQFIANSYDLSGVAIADDGRWVTMISENVFLSANHFFPSNGTSVTFYASNDPSGINTTRSIQSSQRIGTSDLRIGTLNSGLGGSFSFYDFATDDTNNNNTGNGQNGANSESFVNSPYYEADAYMFGRSVNSYATSQDMAVGRNKLDRWFDDVTAAGTTDDAIGADANSNGDANYLQYEALVVSGDSGAPLMVETASNTLTIVGINWFVGNDGSTDLSGFSYVGNYDTEIQAFIDANAVPEFRLFSLLLSLSSFAWILIRRRRG